MGTSLAIKPKNWLMPCYPFVAAKVLRCPPIGGADKMLRRSHSTESHRRRYYRLFFKLRKTAIGSSWWHHIRQTYGPDVPDNRVKFADPRLSLPPEIVFEIVEVAFLVVFFHGKFWLEVVSDVISGVAVDYVGVDVRASFDESWVKHWPNY